MAALLTLTEKEYTAHSDAYDGYCRTCNAITREGDTEPDAARYKCPDCGALDCFGIEQALLVGFIDIGGDDVP